MKVLIVDDSDTMRKIVARTLKKAGFVGHEILEAANGVEALKVIADSSPDVILSDWNMPEMNGLELLQALRADNNSTTFGFITTESTDDARQIARKEGATFFISKPFTAAKFEAHLETVLA